MKSVFIIVSILVAQFGWSQIEYVREQAQILSSIKMHGRSQVKCGAKKAANHIAKEYKRLGLDHFGKDYFQGLSYPINAFPYPLKVNVNGKDLIAGQDFHVSPESGTSRGDYKILEIDKNDIANLPSLDDLDQRIILLNPDGITDNDSLAMFHQLLVTYGHHAPVIWVNYTRLVWSVAGTEAPHALLEVNPGVMHDGDSVKLNVKNKLVDQFKTNNVIGFVAGTQFPDSFVVISAHYDHLGMMGKNACFYGANDNASGVAFMLSMAKYYAAHPAAYSVVFMAFTGEEAGLVGSKYYTQHPLFGLEKIVFLINLDLLGYGEGGIAVVNATLHEREFEIIKEIDKENHLFSKIKKRGGAANSDHYWFEQAGVPSFFLYTMGDNQAYHDIYDRNENLTFEEYPDIFFLLKTLITKL